MLILPGNYNKPCLRAREDRAAKKKDPLESIYTSRREERDDIAKSLKELQTIRHKGFQALSEARLKGIAARAKLYAKRWGSEL